MTHIETESLREPTQRVVRIVGRDLLARVRETSENVGVEEVPEALHDFRVAVRRLRSWLRAFDDELSQTVRPKAQRRLKRIADATRASRDLEVHIDWVSEFTRARRRRNPIATEWLIERLRARKSRADLELQTVLDDNLQRGMSQLAQGLARYIVDLDAPSRPFAEALAVLIREHVDTARKAMSRVSTIGDRAEAHEARITAKRLRYLLEPLSETFPSVAPLVDQLSTLQDDLGALHDAQIFASDIARLLAKELATTAVVEPSESADAGDDDAQADDRTDALRAISQRLHRDERRAFERIKEVWLDEGAEKLWIETEAVAALLDESTAGG